MARVSRRRRRWWRAARARGTAGWARRGCAPRRAGVRRAVAGPRPAAARGRDTGGQLVGRHRWRHPAGCAHPRRLHARRGGATWSRGGLATAVADATTPGKGGGQRAGGRAHAALAAMAVTATTGGLAARRVRCAARAGGRAAAAGGARVCGPGGRAANVLLLACRWSIRFLPLAVAASAAARCAARRPQRLRQVSRGRGAGRGCSGRRGGVCGGGGGWRLNCLRRHLRASCTLPAHHGGGCGLPAERAAAVPA